MRDPWTPRDIARKSLTALAAVAGAVLLRLLLLDIVGPRTPFLTFYPAVMLAALFGGVLSGLLATGLLALVAAAWVLPLMQPLIQDRAAQLALLLFVLSGLLVSFIAEALHRSRRRAAAAEAEAALAAQACELSQARRQLAAIVESTDDAIVGASLDGIITSWNSGATKLYGYDAAEAIGQSTSMLCLPACTDELSVLIRRIQAGESVTNFETQRRHKNGDTIDVSITVSAIRDDAGAISGASAVVRDITKPKRMERALRESEAFARAIIDNSPDCIKTLNDKGELTFISQGGLRLLEIAHADEVLGTPYQDFWQGPDRQATLEALESARRGRAARFTGFCPTAKGAPRWWDVSIAPLATGADSFLVISRDETRRRMADAALRAEKERLAGIIETSRDLMFLKDTELRYLAANAAHETLLGLKPRDMLGRTDFELMPPEMAQTCQQSDLAALRLGAVDQEESHAGRVFRVSKRRVEDAGGQVLGVAATITDITEERRAFDALRESEERFRTLVEHAPDAIFVQAEGRFVYVNASFLRLYRAERPEQVLGQPIVSRVHPLHHQLVHERIRQINERSEQVPTVELRHLRLDGSALDVEVSAVPFVYGGKNGALVFVRDIAARKREEALRDDMERIARHDLKTPLNAVINLPLLLMDEPNLTPEQLTRLQMIHEAGLRMLEQIDQSLTLYRIETGSYVLEPQAVDLAALARQVAGDLAPMARSLGVELRVEADLRPVMASGDPLLCRTMLANLLKNAVEAAPRGSQALARIGSAEGRAVLAIHNQGAVPEELRSRFFEKYASQGKRRGAGLGTYSARLSAEAQLGSIAMCTSEEAGTTITVRLPLWTRPLPEAEL